MSKYLSALLALSLLALLVRPAFADTTPCDGEPYDCVIQWTFEEDAEDWVAVGDTATAWTSEKNFGLFFTSNGAGVVQVSQEPHRIQRTVYLQPGSYTVVYRYATDIPWWDIFSKFAASVRVVLPDAPEDYQTVGEWDYRTNDITHEAYQSFTSAAFDVTTAGPVQIILDWTDLGADKSAWLDWVVIAGAGSVYVPGPGTPTPTPWPTEAQATPLPAVAFNCVEPGTPELGIPLENYWASLSNGPIKTINKQRPAVTPQQLGWSVTTGATTALNASYPGSQGSTFIPYAPDPADGSLDRPAIIWQRVIGQNQTDLVAVPFYIDVAAMASSVAPGSTAYLDILIDAGGSWSTVASLSISSGVWRSGHYTVSAPTNISAVGFAARGLPETGGAYVGRAYIYGHSNLAMRCDGTFPTVATSAYGLPNRPPTTGDLTIIYPADKPCPPPMREPNNFWGPLISGLQGFLYSFTAFWPAHTSPWLIQGAEAFTNAPFVAFASVAFTMWDFRPLLAVFAFILVLEGIRSALVIWWTIKRSIPFLG